MARLSPADAALWKKTEPLLNENILRPPSTREITSALGMDPKSTESFLVRVSRLGLLVRVTEHRFFLPGGLRRYAQFAEQIAAVNEGVVTAAPAADRTGLGRGLAIEVLEYFDRIKFTRRIGDQHQVLPFGARGARRRRARRRRKREWSVIIALNHGWIARPWKRNAPRWGAGTSNPARGVRRFWWVRLPLFSATRIPKGEGQCPRWNIRHGGRAFADRSLTDHGRPPPLGLNSRARR